MAIRKRMKIRKKASFGKYRSFLQNRLDTIRLCILLDLLAMCEDGDVYDEMTGASEQEMDAALEEICQIPPTLNNIKNKLEEWQNSNNRMLRHLSVDFF